VQRQAVLLADLAQAEGKQFAIARLHLTLQRPQSLDRLLDVGPDDPLGDRRPCRQFDELAVQEPHLRVGVKRASRDQQRQRDGLARAGLAPDQHVALDQPHAHELALFVDANR
jgi:hypothetical protein